MAEEQDHERTEPATPFKREEARRRGQVAKSLDAVSVFILGAGLLSATLWGVQSISAEAQVFRRLMGQAQHLSFEPGQLAHWLAATCVAALVPLAPFFLLVVAAALVANLAQTGPVFSFQPLKPDMQRINPVQGFKRIYSSKALFETFKSLLKLGLFAAVAYFAISTLLQSIMGLIGTAPQHYPMLLLDFAHALAFKLLIAVLCIALLDLLYVRWDFGKKLNMSRREQREEVKRREGDPQLRAKRRALQREALKRSESLRRVPDADVLITNPTHLAVALAYERGRALAPRCLAKGAGEAAKLMKELAQRHGVYVVEQRSLARALFDGVEVGSMIPETLYQPVARVYAELAAGSARGAGSLVEVRH
jgi:flagellar biosynthesis protein FlhB